MDESNIIVILQIIVSLFAGVVGAILALVGQHLVSKRTTETEMKKTVLATFLPTMLMYGKEASNRKQEIDRQHYTIPNQRPKDKHCGKI